MNKKIKIFLLFCVFSFPFLGMTQYKAAEFDSRLKEHEQCYKKMFDYKSIDFPRYRFDETNLEKMTIRDYLDNYVANGWQLYTNPMQRYYRNPNDLDLKDLVESLSNENKNLVVVDANLHPVGQIIDIPTYLEKIQDRPGVQPKEYYYHDAFSDSLLFSRAYLALPNWSGNISEQEKSLLEKNLKYKVVLLDHRSDKKGRYKFNKDNSIGLNYGESGSQRPILKHLWVLDAKYGDPTKVTISSEYLKSTDWEKVLLEDAFDEVTYQEIHGENLISCNEGYYKYGYARFPTCNNVKHPPLYISLKDPLFQKRFLEVVQNDLVGVSISSSFTTTLSEDAAIPFIDSTTGETRYLNYSKQDYFFSPVGMPSRLTLPGSDVTVTNYERTFSGDYINFFKGVPGEYTFSVSYKCKDPNNPKIHPNGVCNDTPLEASKTITVTGTDNSEADNTVTDNKEDTSNEKNQETTTNYEDVAKEIEKVETSQANRILILTITLFLAAIGQICLRKEKI